MKLKPHLLKPLVAIVVAILIFFPAAISNGGLLQSDFPGSFLSSISICQKPIPELLTELTQTIIPFFIFMFLYIQFLYKDFMFSAIYEFVRQKSRVKWYFAKALKLLTAAVVYYALYFFSGAGIFILCGANLSQLGPVLLLCITQVFMFTLFSFFFVLLLNLLSICFNIMCGYLAVGFSAFIMLIGTCLTGGYNLFFKLNPIVSLYPDWHSNCPVAKTSIEITNFPLSFSFIYLGLLCVISFIAGYFITKRIDIAVTPKD